jgi:hypothetical protein
MAPENEEQRLNRELIELLNELRVILPGVQVLFAFLLTLPFARGFIDMSRLDRHFYLAALLTTLLASVLLTTPGAYHRFLFRRHDKEGLLELSNRLAIAGLTVLAVAMLLSLFVITDFLFGGVTAIVVVACAASLFGGFWYVLPLRRRAVLMRENGAAEPVAEAPSVPEPPAA